MNDNGSNARSEKYKVYRDSLCGQKALFITVDADSVFRCHADLTEPYSRLPVT